MAQACSSRPAAPAGSHRMPEQGDGGSAVFFTAHLAGYMAPGPVFSYYQLFIISFQLRFLEEKDGYLN